MSNEQFIALSNCTALAAICHWNTIAAPTQLTDIRPYRLNYKLMIILTPPSSPPPPTPPPPPPTFPPPTPPRPPGPPVRFLAHMSILCQPSQTNQGWIHNGANSNCSPKIYFCTHRFQSMKKFIVSWCFTLQFRNDSGTIWLWDRNMSTVHSVKPRGGEHPLTVSTEIWDVLDDAGTPNWNNPNNSNQCAGI